jgi:hypothetical protein
MLLPIGGQCLDQEDHRCHERQHDDARQVPVDISLIDHVADQIGAERGGERGDRHQAECEPVAPPLARCLLHE